MREHKVLWYKSGKLEEYYKPNRKGTWEGYAYLEEMLTKMTMTYEDDNGVVTTFITRLDEYTEIPQQTTGLQAYSCLQKFVKTPTVFPTYIQFSARAINDTNPYYHGKRVHAYYYDINSAYANVMANYRFPDTSVTPTSGYVSEGEIGFSSDGELCFEGDFATYIFPLTQDHPYEKFARYYYDKKANAKTPEEKRKAKETLNFSVGFLQNRNPFIRAFIVNMCNKIINDIVEDKVGVKNWILSNTDCIISTVPIPSLKIGTGLGEWKYKEGTVAVLGTNRYQWDYEIPTYSGCPKGWWKKDYPGQFDILEVPLPSEGNYYYFNVEKGEIEENEWAG